MPGTTGRNRLDGADFENSIETSLVPFAGSGLENDQIGWVPFGAESVIRIRVPAR
jgi:hypothetical protein